METPAKSEVPAIPAMTMSEIPKSAYATLPKIIGSARRKWERITELTDCFLDIFNGQKKPSRSKIIQIALALQLDIRETNNLLSLSDNGYLYPKVRYDAIILYALEHKKSIIDTNLILDMYELPILE